MKKLFLALMAVAAIAIAGCDKKFINDPVAPDNIIPPTDTDGANQNRWGLAPERMMLPDANAENGAE